MVSQLVFNPQSLTPSKKKDDSIAEQAMVSLLNFITAMRKHKLDGSSIRINKNLGKENIMFGYSFIEWCKEHTHKRNDFQLILAFLVNNPKLQVPAWVGLKDSEERIGKDYCFDDETWALAYFFDFVLFSLQTETRWNSDIFECEYFDLTIDEEDPQIAYVRHASDGNHIILHKRSYAPHPKHVMSLPHRGRRDTEMDLEFSETNKEAENILNVAVQIPTKKQLIGYSKRTENLYEFQPEAPPSNKPFMGKDNQYHGYVIEPEELHKDVGGRAYNEIIDSLAERAIIDTNTENRLRIN